MSHSLGGGQAELGGMATDSVGSCVRLRISRSRTPTIIKPACCSAVFTGTKHMVGRLSASQSASASAASFLPRLTYGLTR